MFIILKESWFIIHVYVLSHVILPLSRSSLFSFFHPYFLFLSLDPTDKLNPFSFVWYFSLSSCFSTSGSSFLVNPDYYLSPNFLCQICHRNLSLSVLTFRVKRYMIETCLIEKFGVHFNLLCWMECSNNTANSLYMYFRCRHSLHYFPLV